ncbi:MAG: cyclase family protein [Thermoplasmatota archaeon]
MNSTIWDEGAVLYDISVPVGLGTAVWPGDEAYRLRWTMEQRNGASVNLAAIASTVHVGTHADAFLHVTDAPSGIDAASMPLERYLGPAVVVDARDAARRASGHGLPASLAWGIPNGSRVLFRTREAPTPWAFAKEFTPLSTQLVESLAALHCPLAGTDAPSVDAFDSKDLLVHRAMVERGIAILENLSLANVPPGPYELIALPLRLVGCDASPVRAVLRTADHAGSA